MAETAAALGPAACSAEHPSDFRADWHPGSTAKTTRNSAWLAFRQVQDTENPLSGRQKDTGCDKNGLQLGWYGAVSA